MSSDAGPMWGQLILLLVLILVNAYFAAAEIAIVSVNKNRVRSLAQEGNKKAETLVKLIEDRTNFIGDPGSDHAGRVLFQCTGSVQLFGAGWRETGKLGHSVWR